MAIKNILTESLLEEIPKGKSKANKNARLEIIKRELDVLKNKSFRNASFPVGITVTARSINEIATKAKESYLSTLAALHLKSVLNNAKIVYLDFPKENGQIKKFYAWILIAMRCNIESIGEVKLTVIDSTERGCKGKLDLLTYCLTKEKENKKKE